LIPLAQSFAPVASPFAAHWVRVSWHAKITVEPAPEGCRVYGRTIEGPCWLWHGWTNGKGHGRVKIDGRGYYLHRWSLAALLNIDVGQLDTVDHLCRNRNCFNPLHVESVTPLENYIRGNGPVAAFKAPEAYADNDDEDLEKALRGY